VSSLVGEVLSQEIKLIFGMWLGFEQKPDQGLFFYLSVTVIDLNVKELRIGRFDREFAARFKFASLMSQKIATFSDWTPRKLSAPRPPAIFELSGGGRRRRARRAGDRPRLELERHVESRYHRRRRR
jgi:hypothetical protein